MSAAPNGQVAGRAVLPEPPSPAEAEGGEQPRDVAADLRRAIDNCLIAASHGHQWLKVDHPPLNAPFAAGVKHYGEPNAALELWAICRSIEVMREPFEARVRMTVTAAPITRPAAEVPSALEPAATQRRL
jgi:hypothetical protein